MSVQKSPYTFLSDRFFVYQSVNLSVMHSSQRLNNIVIDVEARPLVWASLCVARLASKYCGDIPTRERYHQKYKGPCAPAHVTLYGSYILNRCMSYTPSTTNMLPHYITMVACNCKDIMKTKRH